MPIVSEEMWHAVHDLLTNPSRPIPIARRKYLLSGLARCGKCGGKVTATSQYGRALYKCIHCNGIARARAEVDNWVIWRVANGLTQTDAWRALMFSDSDDAAQLRHEESALRSRLDELATHFADGVLTSSQLRTATGRIRKRLADVEEQLYGPDTDRYFSDVIDANDPRVAFRQLALARKRAGVELVEAA